MTDEVLKKRREAQRKFRERNPTYYRDKMAEKKAKDPEAYAQRVRRTALKASYGLTPEDYDKMFKLQRGRCSICRSSDPGQSGKKFLCIDHDHKTGRVRGLLCHRCNRGLGLLGDNLKNILATVKYLKGEFSWQK